MTKWALEHKTGCTIFTCAFLVFINCFGFPIYNFTRYARELLPLFSRLYLTLMIGCVFYESGLLLRTTFGRKGTAVAMSLAMTLLGLLCRFLLEFGEVSNTYNFTLPNLVLHLFTAVGLSMMGACFAGRNS